ncbi:MAG: hypothetical protein IPH28_08130 [Cytophagaceae bacterium]|nr:hypothetical protein [Cytophagaceae bacterium]
MASKGGTVITLLDDGAGWISRKTASINLKLEALLRVNQKPFDQKSNTKVLWIPVEQ